ncbi:MAG TPA: glycosyltransferase family 39 protein [Candidatus Udaeobacter sp.]|jgi:tetratricopeptide (TPR) repeat protein|nr:glycosyltransferase family 39 protein [Candidatus Udaeobacter sp.]
MSPRTGRTSKHASRRAGPPPARHGWRFPWTLDGSATIEPAEARLLRRFTFAVAALLGIALLAMVFGPHRIGDYFTETDFYGGYAEGARLIQHGHLDPSRYGVVGPGYELVLALWGSVIRDLFLAAELISVLSTAATVLLLESLVSRRAGARVGFFAALIYATNPWVFRFGYIASTDAFSIMLQVLSLGLVLGGRGRGRTIAAGLTAAAAFLTRYNAIYLLPAGILACWLEGRERNRTGHDAAGAPSPDDRAKVDAPSATRGSGWMLQALTFLIAFLAPIVPWLLFCLANGSRLSFQLYHNIAFEVYARHQGMVWDDYQKKLQPQFHSLWDVVRRDPVQFTLRMVLNVFDHLRLDATHLLGWPATIAALLGIVLALTSGAFSAALPVIAAGALLFLSLVPTFYAERYSMALLPVYSMLAGLFFGLPRFAFALKSRPIWLKSVLIAFPVAVALYESVLVEREAVRLLPVEVLEQARVLRALARPGDRLIARKPHLAFHTGLPSVAFPFTETIPALADYAHRNHVRWLFISWPEVETRPRYWHLLDTTAAMPGLIPRHVTRPHPSVLYEVGPEFGRLPAWYSNDTLMTLHSARAQLLVLPTDVKALFEYALAMRAEGQYDSAGRYADAALAIKPHYISALLISGEMALRRNDAARATEAFTTAMNAHPSNIDAKVGLGWALLISGRVDEAARVWHKVADRTIDPTTLQRMIQVFSRVGDQEALGHAEAMLDSLRTASRGGP